jgi:hypothetical protein
MHQYSYFGDLIGSLETMKQSLLSERGMDQYVGTFLEDYWLDQELGHPLLHGAISKADNHHQEGARRIKQSWMDHWVALVKNKSVLEYITLNKGRIGDGAPSEMLEFMRLPDWIDLENEGYACKQAVVLLM